MNQYVTLTITNTRGTQAAYGVMAILDADGRWHPDVALLSANGEPTRKIIDGEATDLDADDEIAAVRLGIMELY